jgi:hypothetical protein
MWAGLLLAIGAVAFPISRIARIEWMAHLVDASVAIPLMWLGLKEWFPSLNATRQTSIS